MLGLEIPRQSQALHLGWLLSVPGLGLTEASYCLSERIYKVVQHEPRPVIHMEKQLGQACNLGAAESLGISKVCQTVLASLMESEIWHKLAGSVTLWGESLEKGQWPLLTLIPDTSISSSMLLVPFKLLPQS